MKPGRGQQTSLWEGGSVKDSNLTAPTWGQRSTPPSWFTDDEALYWVNGVEEHPVWNLISLPLPKLRNLGAQPCQPGGGIKVTSHPQPKGGRIWGMDQQPEQGCCTGPRAERDTHRKLASSSICWSIRRQRETNSPRPSPWSGFASSAAFLRFGQASGG